MNRPASQVSLCAVIALLLASLSATDARAEVQWTHVTTIGSAVPIATGYFGGDGGPRLVVRGSVPRETHPPGQYLNINEALLLIDSQDDRFFVSAVQSEEDNYEVIGWSAVVFRDGQEDKVLAVRQGRGSFPPPPEFAVYSGSRLLRERSFLVPQGDRPQPIVVADIDGDGALELLYRTSSGSALGEAVIVSLDSGEVEWRSGSSVAGLAAAQLDGDGPLEILMGGTPFQILDGATRAVEWTHPVDQAAIVVGNFSASPSTVRIVLKSGPIVHTISAHPYAHVGTLNLGNGGVLSALDVDGDGVDEIAASSFGFSNVYDAISGVDVTPQQAAFSHLVSATVGRIGQSDQPVIAILQNGTLQLRSSLVLVDGITHARLGAFQFYSSDPPALAIGDLNGDGQDHLLQVSSTSIPLGNFQDLAVRDLGSGMLVDSRLGLGHRGGVPAVALAQLDSDPQLELIVAGYNNSGAALSALDGVTLQPQWSLQGQGSAFTSTTGLVDVVVASPEAGSAPDVWALATSYGLGHVVLTVVDGGTGDVKWQSTPFTEGPSRSLRRMIPAGQDQGEVLLATGNLIRAFDTADQSLSWSRYFPAGVNDVDTWMEGDECRIVVALATSELEIVRCIDRSHVERIALPAEPNLVRAVPGWSRFVVAIEQAAYEVSSVQTRRIADELGPRLGRQGRGLLAGDADQPALIVGSALATSRIAIPLTIFGDGFED